MNPLLKLAILLLAFGSSLTGPANATEWRFPKTGDKCVVFELPERWVISYSEQGILSAKVNGESAEIVFDELENYSGAASIHELLALKFQNISFEQDGVSYNIHDIPTSIWKARGADKKKGDDHGLVAIVFPLEGDKIGVGYSYYPSTSPVKLKEEIGNALVSVRSPKFKSVAPKATKPPANPEDSDAEEARRNVALQRAFAQFPRLALLKNPEGYPATQTLVMNKDPFIIDGRRFDGFTFKVTRDGAENEKPKQNLIWGFVPPPNDFTWFIVPETEEMNGFEYFLRSSKTKLPVFQGGKPRWVEEVLVQHLDGNDLKEGSSYLIVFEFKDGEPAEVSLAWGFSGIEIKSKADVYRALGGTP